MQAPGEMRLDWVKFSITYYIRAKFNTMSTHIRPVQETDFPQLLALFQEFAHFQKTPDKMVNRLEWMEKEKEHFHAFVALNEADEIIGYAAWFYTYHTWVGKCIYLDDLYVREAHRKTGLGKLLFNKVADHGKASGCHRMRWLVSEWNQPAIRFYEKIGADLDHTEMTCELKL